MTTADVPLAGDRMVPHVDEYGRDGCPCGIAEVSAVGQQLLTMFDDWYGDKAYRKHDEVIGWADRLTAPLLAEVARLTAAEPVACGGRGCGCPAPAVEPAGLATLPSELRPDRTTPIRVRVEGEAVTVVEPAGPPVPRWQDGEPRRECSYICAHGVSCEYGEPRPWHEHDHGHVGFDGSSCRWSTAAPDVWPPARCGWEWAHGPHRHGGPVRWCDGVGRSAADQVTLHPVPELSLEELAERDRVQDVVRRARRRAGGPS